MLRRPEARNNKQLARCRSESWNAHVAQRSIEQSATNGVQLRIGVDDGQHRSGGILREPVPGGLRTGEEAPRVATAHTYPRDIQLLCRWYRDHRRVRGKVRYS